MKKGFLFILLFLIFFKASANTCPEFENALEVALRNSDLSLPTPTYKDWGVPKAQDYKLKYRSDKLGDSQNRRFIHFIDHDSVLKKDNLLHFDVENAAQKKLNDLIVGDKEMVDAINNSFFEKMNKLIREDRELNERSQAFYKDYKSLRFRFQLRQGDDKAYFQNKLSDLYKRANDEFVTEFKASQLHLQIPPIADQATDVSTWFLAGMDETPLLANMAARKAREMGFTNGNGKALSFKEVTGAYFNDIVDTEALRKGLAQSKKLLSSGVMAPTPEGLVIPSKDMIKILRKYKPNDSTDMASYVEMISEKVNKIFGVKLSTKEINDFTQYFKKIDSVSPPLFIRTRDKINLGDATGDIVSVDFAGVGVDNAYEQMRALAKMNYNMITDPKMNKEAFLKEAFKAVDKNVEEVTKSMNQAKRFFTTVTIDPSAPDVKPVFSGDDGIFMPRSSWGIKEKKNLVKKLVDSGDPSKYRVTFVPTKFSDGSPIPTHMRSARIVRAEDVEKKLRELVVDVEKIKPERANKLIFAIESFPAQKGGKFNLIVGGEKLTTDEVRILKDSMKKVIQVDEGESFGDIVEVSNF